MSAGEKEKSTDKPSNRTAESFVKNLSIAVLELSAYLSSFDSDFLATLMLLRTAVCLAAGVNPIYFCILSIIQLPTASVNLDCWPRLQKVFCALPVQSTLILGFLVGPPSLACTLMSRCCTLICRLYFLFQVTWSIMLCTHSIRIAAQCLSSLIVLNKVAE